MRLEARKYLYDIQRAAALLTEFTVGKTFADYARDAMLRAAVEREFEIIGEAITQLARVDETVADRISHHERIIAFRNVLIHQYGDVDDRLDLPRRYRGQLEALLREHLPGVEVWAYGSRVNGGSHDGSDLDLVLRRPGLQEIPVGQVADFEEAMRDSSIPFLVEARDWARLPERFYREIERGYVVLAEGGRGLEGEQLFGSLPEDWEYTTLGAACERGGGDIQTGPFGSQLHASNYVPVGIPSIMPLNIGDNRINVDGIARISPEDASRLKRYLVREGDIVYSRRGDVERRALVRGAEDGWLCGTGCLGVRFGEHGVDSRYASYFLGHPSVREWIVRHAHGARPCPISIRPSCRHARLLSLRKKNNAPSPASWARRTTKSN